MTNENFYCFVRPVPIHFVKKMSLESTEGGSALELKGQLFSEEKAVPGAFWSLRLTDFTLGMSDCIFLASGC